MSGRLKGNLHEVNIYRCLLRWLEAFCTTDEPVELLDMAGNVVQEQDVDCVEQRGINSGNEVFQMLVIAFESEVGEGWQDNTSLVRWIY